MRRTAIRVLALTLLAAPLALSLSAQPSCSPTTFLTPDLLPLEGTVAEAVGLADFNGDTFVDVALTGENFGLAVFLGAGDGTFGTPALFPGGSGEALVTADFDGDDHEDVAVNAGGTIYVFIGNGDGTFDDAVPDFANGGYPYTLVAADFDGDDRPDLATSGSFEVSVLLNLGDGTFGDPVRYEVSRARLQGLSGIAAGDLDGDGANDIVAVGPVIYVFRNAGDGTFESPSELVEGPGLGSVATGDVDGDGVLDIGVVRHSYGSSDGTYVGILRGIGGGEFEAALETWAGPNAGELTLADLDGDGRDDALALAGDTQSGAGSVTVLRAEGGASLGPATQWAAAATGLWSLAAADLDGDGLRDVVTARQGGASLLFGNGAARLRSAAGVMPPWEAGSLAPGDFDGDGVFDLIVGGYGNYTIAFYPGHGDGTFGDPRPIDNAEYPPGVFAADFDADGVLDLGVAGFDRTRILMGNGDGAFGPARIEPDFTAVGTGVFTTSGHLDILGRPTGGWDILVVEGNGDGTFGERVVNPGSVYDYGFAVGHLNADALDDIAFVQTPGGDPTGTLRVWLSNGDGTFTESYTHDSLANSPQIFLADLDGDGFLDLLTTGGSEGTQAYFSHGNGTYDDPIVINPGFSLGAVAADFDGDGPVDILTTNYSPSATLYSKGLGGGAFAPGEPLPVFNVRPTAVVPFTGSPDVLSLQTSGWGILINSRLSPFVGSQSVVTGRRAELKVSASGLGALAYQWRKDGVPLTDGGTISGSQTATLTIDPVSFDDAGAYDVLVTDACDSVASNAATLSRRVRGRPRLLPVPRRHHHDRDRRHHRRLRRRQLLPDLSGPPRPDGRLPPEVRARLGLHASGLHRRVLRRPLPSPVHRLDRAARGRGRHRRLRHRHLLPEPVGHARADGGLPAEDEARARATRRLRPRASSATCRSEPSPPTSSRTSTTAASPAAARLRPCSTAPATPSSGSRWRRSSCVRSSPSEPPHLRPCAICAASGRRRRRCMARMPRKGPGASAANAHRQPTAATSRGTSSIDAIVRRNPTQVCTVSAVPT